MGLGCGSPFAWSLGGEGLAEVVSSTPCLNTPLPDEDVGRCCRPRGAVSQVWLVHHFPGPQPMLGGGRDEPHSTDLGPSVQRGRITAQGTQGALAEPGHTVRLV